MKSVAAILATVTILVMSAGAFAQYKLEYKPTGSTPLRYRAHTETKTIESMMGQQATVSVKSNQQVSMTSRMAGDKLLYDITIDSSRSETLMPNGDTTHITSSPAVGQTKETLMHPDGREISTRWLDTTFAKTQEGRVKDLGSFFFRLPDKEVSTGSTWNNTKVDTVARGNGQGDIYVTTNSNYKVAAEEAADGVPCLKIVFTGTILVKGSTSYQGVDFSIDGTGNISGNALFDYTNGRIVKMNGLTEQKLNMVSSGQRKMSIPMTQNTSYDLFLVR